MKKLTSAALASLVLVMVGSGTSASANPAIQGLPDGNYRSCSNPPSDTQVRDEELLEAGYCFLFRKTGNQLVGNYFNVSVSLEDSVCLTGRVSNAILTGEGLQLSQGLPNGMSKFAGSQLTNWDDWGYLKVAQSKLLGTYEQTGYSRIHHRRAVLDMSNFYRYNAGIYAPPSNCFN